MSSFRVILLRLMVMLGLLLMFVLQAAAQAPIAYGDGVSGSISAAAPLAFYPFTGTDGDLVTVQVIALTPGFSPSVSLNAPNQQQLAFNSGDPFSPGVARISLRLPQTGVFTLLVSSNDGTPGDFALRLDGESTPDPTPIDEASPANALLGADSNSVFYSVIGNPDAPLNVTVSTSSSSFAFSVALRSQAGQTLAIVNGSDTSHAILTLPASSMTYEIEARSANMGTEGQISVAVTAVGATPAQSTSEPPPTEEATDEAPDPSTTEEAQPPTDGVCRATRSGADSVNARSGPGTDFAVVTSLQPNDPRPVLGINTPSNWYLLSFPNEVEAWVRGDLFTLSGDCSAVPEVVAFSEPEQPSDPPQGQATATATATATSAPPQQGQPSPTPTASHTPTVAVQQEQATPTFTPSYTPTTAAAQIAPEDPRFNNDLNIELDTTASVLEFVSFPDGDTEDRVRYDVTGMNQNASLSGGRARLVISATCFGENIDQIQFFTGGQTYSCGETLVDREVTANSDTGSVVITAIGGEGTYVQWVLTGTATRVN